MNHPSLEKQVLYVDDEPQALKYFQKLFGDQFNIAVASSASEAWEYIQSNSAQVGVLVTDQRMPEKTGIELMKQLREFHPNIIRVLTTAYTNLDSAIKSVNEGGAFRYLTKPWQDSEMVGTLLRAMEFHKTLEQRDLLVHQKLSVLHRLVMVDRVRGLSAAATAFQGSVRGASQALVNYMQLSGARQRLGLRMAKITDKNMVEVARHEAAEMIKTVQAIRKDVIGAASGDDSNVDVRATLSKIVQTQQTELEADDLKLALEASGDCSIRIDQGLFQRLIEIMIRRLADIQNQPARLRVVLKPSVLPTPQGDCIQVSVSGDFGPLTDDQFAAFFSAAIPLQKWPLGLDMDLLSAFMIAQHAGGEFSIDPSSATLTATLPFDYSPASPNPTDATEPTGSTEPSWFDIAYESFGEWARILLQ